jgi:hypothetical protein
MKKAKAHIRYKNKDGIIVPGVTTILSVMAKPALKYWANKLGLQGIEVNKYVDILADAGTLAHSMVECKLKNIECNTYEYSQHDIDLAKNSINSFDNWLEQNKFESIFLEKEFVSEQYQFGGTIDIYGKLNEKLTLIDLKTSKAIYSEMETQACAYALLLEENNCEVEQIIILRIGRTKSEKFEERIVDNVELHQRRFIVCRELYNLNKELG